MNHSNFSLFYVFGNVLVSPCLKTTKSSCGILCCSRASLRRRGGSKMGSAVSWNVPQCIPIDCFEFKSK